MRCPHFLFIGLLPIFLVGCQYTSPLCNDSNVLDYPQLAGEYVIKDPSSSRSDQNKIERLGAGNYRQLNYDTQAESLFTSCRIHGQWIFESKSDGFYSAAFIGSKRGGFEATLLTFDEVKLKAAGITQIQIPSPTQNEMKFAVVNNADITPEKMLTFVSDVATAGAQWSITYIRQP